MKLDIRSRTPLMIGMALILALPLVLTAGIGIYRAEHAAPGTRSLLPESEPGQDADRDDTEPRNVNER